MKGISPLLILPPVIFIALAGLFVFGLNRENPDNLPSALAGQGAPELSVEPLAGFTALAQQDLASGEVILVNFWASWCGPCRAEHPTLQALSKGGLKIFGVNYKDKPDNAIGFLNELGNPYAAIGADPTGRTGLDWGIYGVPETFVIDKKGRIVERFAGPVTQRVLKTTIMPAIKSAR